MLPLPPRSGRRSRYALLGVFVLLLGACQWRGAGFLSNSGPAITLEEVRTGLGMSATDRITHTHRVVVVGSFAGPEAQGRFERAYEPDGSFEHRSISDEGWELVERYDGQTLWVDSFDSGSLPMTPARAHVASSVEWTLGGRWLMRGDSPFEASFQRAKRGGEGPRVRLRLPDEDFESELQLHPVSLQPSELTVPGRGGPLRLELSDWRTRRGFPWPYRIVIHSLDEDVEPTILETEEVLFEPSLHAGERFDSSAAHQDYTRFDPEINKNVPIRRTQTGHILVRPSLRDREVGWFLLDTGTGVNCLDPSAIEDVEGLLQKAEGTRSISIIGLGGSVEGEIRSGAGFRLGPMRTERMEWALLDLSSLEKVVGAPLVGVLGGELFERTVIEIDLASRTLTLHDPKVFQDTPLPWKPLRFDGVTPCVQCSFAPNHEGWFRLDTGSDDTVTFHAPWVRKLGLIKRARNVRRMRLSGIGGELMAKQGRIPWFEFLGMRFRSPRVTLVERAEGPLANPDLMGNLGVGFLDGQRLVLDYAHHRVALIPR